MICKDERGRLRVAAAVGVTHDTMQRIDALVKAGVDAIIIDTAHGHSKGVIITLKEAKAAYPKLEIIVGNIATGAAAKALIEAEAARAQDLGDRAGTVRDLPQADRTVREACQDPFSIVGKHRMVTCRYRSLQVQHVVPHIPLPDSSDTTSRGIEYIAAVRREGNVLHPALGAIRGRGKPPYLCGMVGAGADEFLGVSGEPGGPDCARMRSQRIDR